MKPHANILGSELANFKLQLPRDGMISLKMSNLNAFQANSNWLTSLATPSLGKDQVQSSMSGLQWATLLLATKRLHTWYMQHLDAAEPKTAAMMIIFYSFYSWHLDRNPFLPAKNEWIEMLSYTFLYLLSHCAFSAETKEEKKKNRHGMWLSRLHLVANCQFPDDNLSPKHKRCFFFFLFEDMSPRYQKKTWTDKLLLS